MKKTVKSLLFYIQYSFWFIKSFYNRLFLDILINKYKKVHIGCGNVRVKNFINVDYRVTNATDFAADCSTFDFLPNKSMEVVFANAFLEHLYLSKRQQCINEMYRVLKNRGKAIVLSIPDFEAIATAYLNKQNFSKNKVFDLYEVYRFTHGEPEQAPSWWLAQLHKSLFDINTIQTLFKNAGFSQIVIFRCSFENELTAVNLGVLAYKKPHKKKDIDKKMIQNIFEQFQLNFNTKTASIVSEFSSLKSR